MPAFLAALLPVLIANAPALIAAFKEIVESLSDTDRQALAEMLQQVANTPLPKETKR
jgi:hypothetical protein